MKLRAGALHVWRVDLDDAPAELARVLDRAELDRAGRIARERPRRRWVASRAVLRVLLGAYASETPAELRLRSGEHGKPVLAGPHGARLHFNLSHSGSLAVCALTEISPVGVDVELIARGGARGRDRERLRAWVSYEAQVKRTGAGIFGDGIRGGALRPDAPAAWTARLDVGPDAVGAVALAAEPREVVYRDWPAERSAVVAERQLVGNLAQARRGAVAI
jgi:4'-phosphopantetheinyl transferase